MAETSGGWGFADFANNLGAKANAAAQAAANKAAELDKQYHVSQKVAATTEAVQKKAGELDEKYHVSKNVASTTAAVQKKAGELDEQYHVSKNVASTTAAAKERAAEFDKNYQISQQAAAASSALHVQASSAMHRAQDKIGGSKAEGPPALLSGWLQHRGPVFGYDWKPRWCVLTPTSLNTFKQEDMQVKLGARRLTMTSKLIRLGKAMAPGDAVKHKSERPFGFVLDLDPDGGKERKLDYFDAGDAEMLSRWEETFAKVIEKRRTTVTLHVYDVSTNSATSVLNSVVHMIGTGAFHGAVEIHGKEWSFGECEEGTGVFGCEPTKCEMHVYREAIEMGSTTLTKEEVDVLLERLRKEWPGSGYDLLRRNCCHFSDAFCRELGVGEVPSWVMSMANAGAGVADASSCAWSATKGAAATAANKAAEMDEKLGVSASFQGRSNESSTPAKDPSKPGSETATEDPSKPGSRIEDL